MLGCRVGRADVEWGAAASVGTYLALATANRVAAPRSKLAFADWWASTAAGRWVRLSAAATDHRRFWDAMDAVDSEVLVQIERRLALRMVGEHGGRRCPTWPGRW
jgi:hypothetical protein